MKKTMRTLSGLILIVSMTFSVQAQKGRDDGSKYGHGEDSIRCITNLSLYREYARNKDYTMAREYWRIAFNECPKASKNTYIDGAKMYKYFLGKVKSPERKNELTDTLMLVYEQRIENFGQRGMVKGRQGADLLKFRRNDGVKYVKQGYGYLKESIKLQKAKSSKAVLPTMLSASITLFNSGEAEAKQVIQDYMEVSNIIDIMIEKKPNDKRLKDLKSTMDVNFVEQGPGDCETLIGYFTEEHKTKKEDVEFLTMLTGLLRKRECTNSNLFFVASKDLHKISPSSESALNIALLARNKEEYAEAINYYNQAINLEQNADKTADLYFGIAICNQKLNKKTSAREAALKAAAVRPGFGEPYILIGQLYADSKKDCASLELSNSVFWAAVDMFLKAKAVDASVKSRADKLIATYSKYFPNKEEAFFLEVTEGKTFKIGCWINVTTKARF